MPPVSMADRQKLLLQQEIAKLSGAISRHATSSNHHHPYHRGRASSRAGGSSRARGSRGRGRGRGGSYGLDLRAANKVSSNSTTPTTDAGVSKQAGEASDSPSPQQSHPALPDPAEQWVKTTSKRGNMSIMTMQKRQHLQSLPRATQKRPPKIPPHIQILNSSSTSEGQRVVIDGVIFQFEQGGTKLARIGELPSSRNPDPATPTRRTLRYDGQKYRRTSRGNLVRSKSRAPTPCRYYTKTGRCNRALTCPYAHIPDRLAICSRYLRSNCPNTAETCPLSHTPSAHNTPSCVHFQATSTCRNGPQCPYPHIRVAEDAPVCEAFARKGWCDAAPGTCPNLHVWECGEWRDRGTCSRGNKCGLRHILRAEKGKRQADTTISQHEVPVPVQGGFEDGAEFINLDQGSPPEIISDQESELDSDDSGGESEEDSDDGEQSLTSDGGHSPSIDTVLDVVA